MAAAGGFRLDEQEQQLLEEQGFVVRPAVFDSDEVSRIRQACEDLTDRLARGRKGERVKFGSYVFDADRDNGVMIKWEGDSDIVHGLEPFAHLSEELSRWAHDERFLQPMMDVLGIEDPMLFTEKLNLKRPFHGGANPMHQDYPYWVNVAEEASEVATAMLLLDDSTLENGCLHVVPGSHKGGPWEGRTDADRFGANEIDQARYSDVDLVPVEIPAGGMVMFGAMLVHQSAPNTSDKERRALLFSYQPSGRRTQLEAFRAGYAKRDAQRG